jgi:hypothetical protein
MFEVRVAVGQVCAAVDGLARGVEPEVVPASACVELVGRLARAERQLAGVKARLAGRVADTSVWQHHGHRSAAHWLARQSGSSVAEAVGVLQTAERLKDLPVVSAAVIDGTLSRAQAAVVADAATVAPDAEAELVAVAGRESLKALQDDAARRKVAHLDDQARWQRIHDSRHVRFGTDPDGAATLSARTTAEAMAEIKAAVGHYQTKIFDTARQHGRRDPFEAYAADGLLALARASMAPGGPGAAVPKRVPTKVIVRVDHTALARGHTQPGERCEITGTGPLPARHVAGLLASGEAFTAVVATDERNQVTTVAHLGHHPVADIATLPEALGQVGVEVTSARTSRRPDVYQQTALDWTTPTCAIAGCDQPRHQIDHRADWADTHLTQLDELDGYGTFHHAEKTRHGPQIPQGIGRRARYDTAEGPAP